VVIQGKLPATLQKSAEMYAGCVAGALQKEEYLNTITQAGFKEVEIKTSKNIELPDEVLKDYLSEKEMSDFKESNLGIFSITVVGTK
jgi:hypothetical protein